MSGPSAEARRVCRSKRRFASQEVANEQLARARARAAAGETNRQEQRAYPCLVCFCWHLTSKPLATAIVKPLPPEK